jgi:hypothetical protein
MPILLTILAILLAAIAREQYLDWRYRKNRRK